LAQLYLASLAGVTLDKQPAILPDLATATARVRQLGVGTCIERALDAVFLADLEEDADDPRGVARLRALVHDSDVEERLAVLGQLLCDGQQEEFDPFIRHASVSTLGAAVREAFQRLCPNV